MVYELITCYSQSRDPFRLCNTDNWIDWSSACTCHMKYSRQRWKWPPKSAHPMMWLYNCHPGCFFVFRRKWFIDCSCILQCFFMLVWIDTIVWSGLDAKSSMSVGCCTHTMLFYVNRLGLTLWKCLLPLAELGTCLNMQIEFTHLLHSVPPPTHTADFQFQPHTLHTFSFNHTHTHFTVLYMPRKPIHSQSTSTLCFLMKYTLLIQQHALNTLTLIHTKIMF